MIYRSRHIVLYSFCLPLRSSLTTTVLERACPRVVVLQNFATLNALARPLPLFVPIFVLMRPPRNEQMSLGPPFLPPIELRFLLSQSVTNARKSGTNGDGRTDGLRANGNENNQIGCLAEQLVELS